MPIEKKESEDTHPPRPQEPTPGTFNPLPSIKKLTSSKMLLVAIAMVVAVVAVVAYVALNQTFFTKSAEAPLAPLPPPTPEELEVASIKTLLDDVRQANLREDIELFMSCYSRDFKDRDDKKRATLKAWKEAHYDDLFYVLKDQKVTGDMAEIRVEWLVRISRKPSEPPQEAQVLVEASLRKEDGRWKIVEIKPTG